jgi:hypothetical protein
MCSSGAVWRKSEPRIQAGNAEHFEVRKYSVLIYVKIFDQKQLALG